MSELIPIDHEIAAVIADAESAAAQGSIDACPHPAGSQMERVWLDAYSSKWEELFLLAA